MSVEFGGMGSMVVTMKAVAVTTGGIAGMDGNDTVRNANGGVAPVGVVLNKRNNHAAVQIRGYVRVKYSGSPAPVLGWNRLVTDGAGGLRPEQTGETKWASWPIASGSHPQSRRAAGASAPPGPPPPGWSAGFCPAGPQSPPGSSPAGTHGARCAGQSDGPHPPSGGRCPGGRPPALPPGKRWP